MREESEAPLPLSWIRRHRFDPVWRVSLTPNKRDDNVARSEIVFTRLRAAWRRLSCIIVISFSLVAAALISACGGGGGGGGGSQGASNEPYSLSATNVSFSTLQGSATPAPKVVVVKINSGAVFVSTSQLGVGFGHQFQITGPTTGQITITPDAPLFGAGTFTGSIIVRGCSTVFCSGTDVSGSPKTINVTYTVTVPPTVTSTPGDVNFVTSTAAGLPPARNVALTTGTGSTSWTSSVVYTANPANVSGWLDVTPTSGALPATVNLHVNSVPTPPGSYFAAVFIDDGRSSTRIAVSIVVKPANVEFVTPYIGTAGIGGNVVIRGSGFTGVTQVTFGGTPASSVSLVSDSEIRATYPALGAGSYSVGVSNATQTFSGAAQLLVVGAPNYSYATLPPAGSPGFSLVDLVYDAERKAVFMSRLNYGLQVYRFNGVGWDFTGAPSSGTFHMALAANGSDLFLTGSPQLQQMNPATLVESLIDLSIFTGAGQTLHDIASLNDGTVVGTVQSGPVSLFNLKPTPLTFRTLSSQPGMSNRILSASGDGSRVVIVSADTSSSIPIAIYDTGSGTLTNSAVNTIAASAVSQSRDGARLIITSFALTPSQLTTVYDASLNPLGVLPIDLTGVGVTPDGSTAYAYFAGTRLVRKFNLNSPNGSGGFTEIGTGTLIPDSPGTEFAHMVFSPDGGTLFLGSDVRLIVVPAP